VGMTTLTSGADVIGRTLVTPQGIHVNHGRHPGDGYRTDYCPISLTSTNGLSTFHTAWITKLWLTSLK
jgi:hypothetical protein